MSSPQGKVLVLGQTRDRRETHRPSARTHCGPALFGEAQTSPPALAYSASVVALVRLRTTVARTCGKGRHVSIDFQETTGVFRGSGSSGREWRISRALTGWRLEFTDPGDLVATFAGVHSTLSAAKAEASTQSTTRRRR